MNSRPFTQNWYPGERGYKEHIDRQIFSYDNIAAIREQTNQIKESVNQQSINISDQTGKIIASNEQIISAIDEGFNRLSYINERGFSQVTSAIEDMNSDMNYYLGVIVQKLEYQNSLLNGILHTLQTPFETQVKEFYNNGCKFIRQENLDAAIECFKESISQKMGKYFFPSYYQLGRLYISGKVVNKNIIDPAIAMEYLLKANELGNGIIKDDTSFRPILSDCKFFLSQSYYFQLSGNLSSNEIDLLNNAIKFCEEATELNPKLSQGWYHLAKYYSFRIQLSPSFRNSEEIEKLLICYLQAVEIDRNYLRTVIPNDPFYDKALESVKEDILNLISRLLDIKRKDAAAILKKAQNYIALLEGKNIHNSPKYNNEFIQLQDLVLSSERDFKTNTYFGYDDCLIKLETL